MNSLERDRTRRVVSIEEYLRPRSADEDNRTPPAGVMATAVRADRPMPFQRDRSADMVGIVLLMLIFALSLVTGLVIGAW